MSNDALYRTTKTEPIGITIKRARLRMFGHVLRLNENSPAQRAMDLYFKIGTRPRGKPTIMLPNKLKHDLVEAGLKFENSGHLRILRRIAGDRDRWRDVIRRCGAGPLNY